MMLITSMKSLKLMSVAVQTILKNLATILTVLGDGYFFGKKLTLPMFGAFGLMILGSYVGTSADAWVTPEGLFWTFANIFFTVAYVLYMKLLLGDVSKELGRYGPVYYNNLLSLPFLVVPALPSLPAFGAAIVELPFAGSMCLLVTIFIGTVMSFCVFWCMNMTSPTTYSVVGSLNKIPLTLLGIFVFSHTPSFNGAIGILFALSGGMVYTYISLPGAKPASKPASPVAPDSK
jgi:GDP-mannose transporter